VIGLGRLVHLIFAGQAAREIVSLLDARLAERDQLRVPAADGSGEITMSGADVEKFLRCADLHHDNPSNEALRPQCRTLRLRATWTGCRDAHKPHFDTPVLHVIRACTHRRSLGGTVSAVDLLAAPKIDREHPPDLKQLADGATVVAAVKNAAAAAPAAAAALAAKPAAKVGGGGKAQPAAGAKPAGQPAALDVDQVVNSIVSRVRMMHSIYSKLKDWRPMQM